MQRGDEERENKTDKGAADRDFVRNNEMFEIDERGADQAREEGRVDSAKMAD